MRQAVVWGALVSALAMGATSANAAGFFHLHLVKTEPAKNDTVGAPKVIRLWFSMEPAMSVTSIALTAATGQRMALGKATFSGKDGDPVEVLVTQPLSPGQYRAAWKTASKDMHPVAGSYPFVVR
jgi:methionine-rich copper-binding protein CopC